MALDSLWERDVQPFDRTSFCGAHIFMATSYDMVIAGSKNFNGANIVISIVGDRFTATVRKYKCTSTRTEKHKNVYVV